MTAGAEGLLGRFLAAAPGLNDFSVGAVEAVLGVRFAVERDHLPSYTLLRADGAPPVDSVELRAPGPAARFGGLLIAHLLPGAVTLKWVLERLDRPEIAEIDVPGPPLLPPGATAAPPPPPVGYRLDTGRNAVWVSVHEREDRPVASIAVHGA